MDLAEISESLILVSRMVEENRNRLERAMNDPTKLGSDGLGEYDPKHVQGVKLLADAAKSLSQEARQWSDVQRERAKNRSVADNVALAVRYLASLQKGDRAQAYLQLIASEADRNDGLPLILATPSE